MEFLVVGLGGFLGAMARYFVYLAERSIGAHSFPFGTLFINLLGCLLAGLLLAVVERSVPVHRHLVLLGSMGLIGSFTTFSTFSVESFQLIRANQLVLAMINVGANMVLGIGAVWVGRAILLKL
ncbi:MAG: fluoride efflux transporter CrcB [Bdellovibrionota bacterium]